MGLSNINICDSGLFVSGDNTLRHFRNNGIENVSQLISIVEVDDLELGVRTREETKTALGCIIELARYKYLGQPMVATERLNDTFQLPNGYQDKSLKERRKIAKGYFTKFGFRPIDSFHIFYYFKNEFPAGVKIIDGFHAMCMSNKDDDCLSEMMTLYIRDYHEQNKYAGVCQSAAIVTESNGAYVKRPLKNK